MKTYAKKLQTMILIVIATFFVLSTSVSAQVLPQATFNGTINYTYSDYLLEINPLNITDILYVNGTDFASDAWTPPWVDPEPILDASIYIGNLYNDEDQDSDPDNMGWNRIFGPDQPSGGDTGPVSFSIIDYNGAGSEDDVVYMTGWLDYFEITTDEIVNPNFSLINVYGVTYSANGSRYIEELQGVCSDCAVFQIHDFTFGVNDSTNFTGDVTSTSILGTVTAGPEPVSSILFMAGGATFAFRRFWKKRSS